MFNIKTQKLVQKTQKQIRTQLEEKAISNQQSKLPIFSDV